jgi:thymidylate synthase ThyX
MTPMENTSAIGRSLLKVNTIMPEIPSQTLRWREYNDFSNTYLKHMGDDLDVVNAAKVSFAKESKEFDDNSVRLIKYLAKHKHMSPFGHCFASFHVKAPIFVARQLVKHKFSALE